MSSYLIQSQRRHKVRIANGINGQLDNNCNLDVRNYRRRCFHKLCKRRNIMQITLRNMQKWEKLRKLAVDEEEKGKQKKWSVFDSLCW